MKNPYGKLTGLRRKLLRDYDAEKLHKLRIALRRMRSTLRSRPEPEARQLREELGLLADATNAARDWDTLAVYAAEHLRKHPYRRIEPWLEANCKSAHRRVIRALRSEQWSITIEHWKHYTRAHHDDAPVGEVVVEESDVAFALRRLARRRDRVLSRDTSSRWHKVRIAVKDLRYQLDSRGTPEHKEEIALCERLQECLGQWHDCVVHDELLCELGNDADLERKPRAAKALRKLRKILKDGRQSSLTTARAILTGTEVKAMLSRAQEAGERQG